MNDICSRFFAAIPLPAELKTELQRVQIQLQHQCTGYRWVDPGLMHITLLFFGDQTHGAMDDLGSNIRKPIADVDGFQVCLGGLGAFPDLQNPRVIWVGVTEGSQQLYDLFRIVRDNARRCGLTGLEDGERFHAHVTLARARKNVSQKTINVHEKQKLLLKPSMIVNRVELLTSELTPAGPKYNVRDCYFLK